MKIDIIRNRIILTLALSYQLAGCTQPVAPSPTVTPAPASAAVVKSPTPSATPVQPVSLFDGRLLDGKETLPGPNLSDSPSIEDEVKRAAGQEPLKRLAGPGTEAPNADNFDLRAAAEGAFTRPGAAQKIFLYRYGLTNGLVITEDKAVVAHFGGGPGDYAFYTYLVPQDVNADGLTDIILYRNVEDSEDIYAYLFTMSPSGPVYGGSATVYSSTAKGGDDVDPTKVESRACNVIMKPGQPDSYSMAEFKRVGQGEWEMQGQAQPFSWEQPKEGDVVPKFENLLKDLIDPAKLKSAIERLDSYADVPSSIDYSNPKNEAQQMVATDPTLQLMEILDTRAAVYATENATKEKVDHSDVSKYSLSLDGLTSVKEIEDAYIKHTNDSLGGESPYGSR